MRKRELLISAILALMVVTAASAVESQKAGEPIGQDLHVAGRELTAYQITTDKTGVHILVLPDGFSMSFGPNRFSSDKAVVWLETVITKLEDGVRVDYKTQAYLQGTVSVRKAEGATLSQVVLEGGRAMVVRFNISGEVFVTAEKREIADPRGLELYQQALAAVAPAEPLLPPEPSVPAKIPPEKPVKEPVPAKPEEKKPRFGYPVSWAPAGEVVPEVERTKQPDGTYIVTVMGRLYVWQKLDEEGGLLELQADNAVIFYSEPAEAGGDGVGLKPSRPSAGQVQDSALAQEESSEAETFEDILAGTAIQAIYLSGDVVMQERQRTIRADELYYDFQRKKALATNAVMRNFDVSRGIPIYVRAAKFKQVAEDRFEADNITLTTSEFHLPQISLNASEVIITDTTAVDEWGGRLSDRSFDAQMRDVRFKMYDQTIFYWPFVRSNLQRPDVPLKGMHVGHDRTWGTSVETEWYLARLLGLAEPEGTDSTITLDYYSKRGVGSGLEIDYAREDYFGRILGYIIDDSGEDRLGRTSSRRDLEPPRDLRGRFRWQHRHFLPYNWQLTAEASYASDRNFIEQFYRREFNTDKEQETLLHLKRIEDNWGLAFLGKGRLNDFTSTLEELPSAEFHWTGQSFFDDR